MSEFRRNALRMSVYGGGTPAFEKSGIGIQLADGTIIDQNNPAMKESYSRDEVIGITFEKGHVSCVICPDTVQQKYFCGGNSVAECAARFPTLLLSCKYYSYGGEADILRDYLKYSDWAVNVAYAKTLNGQHCYLPSESELVPILAEAEAIDALLAKIDGCEPLPSSWYWSTTLANRKDTSTGESTYDPGGYLWYVYGCTKAGTTDGLNVQGYYNVLPIAPIVK